MALVGSKGQGFESASLPFFISLNSFRSGFFGTGLTWTWGILVFCNRQTVKLFINETSYVDWFRDHFFLIWLWYSLTLIGLLLVDLTSYIRLWSLFDAHPKNLQILFKKSLKEVKKVYFEGFFIFLFYGLGQSQIRNDDQ